MSSPQPAASGTDINTLRAERARLNEAVQALAQIEAEGGVLTEAQVQEFDTLQAHFNELTGRMARIEAAEQMAAAAAQPVDRTAALSAASSTVPVQPKTPDIKGGPVARMVRALVAAQGNPQLAAKLAMERGFGEDVAMALTQTEPGAGGVLVPSNLSAEIIELLRPKAVVRSLGARSLPLSNGNLIIPRLRGGAIVGYIGFDTDAPVTQPQFDDLRLSSKKMAALVPISNDLLAYAGVQPSVDQVVAEDLTQAIALREDKAFIRDDGSANTPKGLRHWCLPTQLFAASAGHPLQAIENDLNRLILALESANANMTTPGWICAPRTFRFLEGLRDGVGNKAYPELASDRLKGYPIRKTTQVPVNLADEQDDDLSELYFCDFGDCFIGEDEQLLIDYSKEATYRDADSHVVSAFQRDQTLVRVIVKHDFGPRHQESIAVMTGVRWGV